MSKDWSEIDVKQLRSGRFHLQDLNGPEMCGADWIDHRLDTFGKTGVACSGPHPNFLDGFLVVYDGKRFRAFPAKSYDEGATWKVL